MKNVNVMSELEVMNAAMQVGWVKFSYVKSDGTKRVAIGTRNKGLIEQVSGRPLRENKSYYRHCNGYFDLSRIDWRQFNTDRFIGMEFDRLTNEQAVINALAIILVSDDYNLTNAVNARARYTSLVEKSFLEDCMCEISSTNADLLERYDWISDTELIGEIVKIATPKVSRCVPTTHKIDNVPTHKNNRDALIAELMELRKRESDILAELLA